MNATTSPSGIIRGMPDAEYQALPMLRASEMPHAARSMAHLRAARQAPREETDALLFGSLFHAAIDGTASRRFVAAAGPINDRTGEPYGRSTKKYAEWAAQQSGRVVPVDWWDTAHRMAESVRSTPECLEWLEGAELEVSFAATIEGVRCKARADLFNQSRGRWADWKSTAFSAEDFGNELSRRKYPLIGAFQRAVIEAAMRGACHEYAWIAVEKQEPYGVIVWTMPVEELTAFADQVASIIRAVGKAESSGEWPCYAETLRRIQLKPWQLPDIQEEIAV